MKVTEFLDKVAHTGASEIAGDEGRIYYSNFDGSYITRVGMEANLKCLADREITEQLTHGVGFSPKDGKWYGWSHRAIFGFKVGSTCKKGDCHYRPKDLEDEINNAIRFWSDDEFRDNVRAELADGHIKVEWECSDNIPNKRMRGKTVSDEWQIPDEYGRGEWVAETMDDAKQMAVDFSEGVS